MSDIKSLNDIFNDDELGLLDDGKNSIFELKHVSTKPRAEAEMVAKRKRCKDFEQYKDLFIKVQGELKAGERKLLPFNDKGEQLVPGSYYVLGGVLLYLEHIDFTSDEKTINGKRFRKDGRTRCIFENGTESNMLYRSLAKSLYQDGKIVSDTNEESDSNFYKNFGGVTDEDTSTGFIYVLKSQSADPRIQSIEHLYKIGFSTTTVKKRIANAAKEPTYLMAPVEVIAEYQAFNINAQKFENLLHAFFGKACLELEVTGKDGTLHKPREWFVAPIDVIQQSIQLLVNGQILYYRYNSQSKQIEIR